MAESETTKMFQQVQEIFNQAGFIADLGIELVAVGAGWCESQVKILPKHLQHNGFIHAGVQATLADHTAGGAGATTLATSHQNVLTIEFKINLLRPAVGDTLRCKSSVLRSGKTVVVSESEVYAVKNGQEKLVSKATVTLAVVNQQDSAS